VGASVAGVEDRPHRVRVVLRDLVGDAAHVVGAPAAGRGRPVRFQQVPAEAFKAMLTGRGMPEAMAQGTVDMLVAKNQGLDNAEPRTPQSTTPTGFRQWCEEVLKPAVLG
jgi:hypothetical protein